MYYKVCRIKESKKASKWQTHPSFGSIFYCHFYHLTYLLESSAVIAIVAQMLHYCKWQVMNAVSRAHLIVIAETSSHGSAGSPHLMIGIIAGLISTLVILAFLIVVLIKVHTRRHPPPPLNSTFERTTSTNSTAVGNNSSSSTSTNPQRLQNAVKNRKGPFHTSSSSPGSDDPDLIPLQKTKHLGK